MSHGTGLVTVWQIHTGVERSFRKENYRNVIDPPNRGKQLRAVMA